MNERDHQKRDRGATGDLHIVLIIEFDFLNTGHGIVAAPFDQSFNCPWSNRTNVVTEATGSKTGDGQKNTEKIVSAMNQTTEKIVKLKDAIPVFIIYYTAWVDNDGQLNFRDDVYQHDSELIKKMFTNTTPSPKAVRIDNLKTN